MPPSKMTSQLHEHVEVLTPIKRRRGKRPSYSPVKTFQPVSKTRTQSETLQCQTSVVQPEDDIATASLEFEEFSYWDPNRQDMNNISSQHVKALVAFLLKNYGVCEIQESLPFLILFCHGEVPPLEKRPFSIAGCIAVWLKEGDSIPGDISIGDLGLGDPLTIEEDLAADLKPFRLPRDDTLFRILVQYFSDACFISFISHSIIIEYQKQDEKSWSERVQTLPSWFENTGVALNFSNGPLVKTELKRLKVPQPANLATLQEDDSDYVLTQGCFSPGAMLQAESGNQITAGVAVEKGLEKRVTVAFHCWEEEYKAVPAKLGDENHLTVRQAQTPVGHVDQRIGETDIGLMKLNQDVVFQNRFLDIPTVAKILLPSAALTMSDEFYFDSFVTGRQRIRCQGRRLRVDGEWEELKGEPANLPKKGKYISLRQGVYASGSREIHGVPKIRAGVCGSALVRVKKGGPDGGNVLVNGEVAGFMHWSDLQLKNDVQGNLYCFADSVDDLIEAGWTISQVTVKQNQALLEESDDERQAASKRPRVEV